MLSSFSMSLERPSTLPPARSSTASCQKTTRPIIFNVTALESILLQVLILLDLKSPRIKTYKNPGEGVSLSLTTNPIRDLYPERPSEVRDLSLPPTDVCPTQRRGNLSPVVTSLRHYISAPHTQRRPTKPSPPKNAKMNLYLGGDTVSTEAVAARRHAGTHLPVTWWKLEMPTTTWHLLLN